MEGDSLYETFGPFPCRLRLTWLLEDVGLERQSF